MKPRAFLDLIEHSKTPLPVERDGQAEILLTLLAHLIHADQGLDEAELSLLEPLAPGVADVPAYFGELATRELDLDALAAAFPDPSDRADIVKLADHAVWGDGLDEARELDLFDALTAKLGVAHP